MSLELREKVWLLEKDPGGSLCEWWLVLQNWMRDRTLENFDV